MERIRQDLGDGHYRVIEPTGEIHYTLPDRPLDEGYRLYQGLPCELLTQEQIDKTLLPYFEVENYSEYPDETMTLMPTLRLSLSRVGCVVAERVARIRIAQHLDFIKNLQPKY